MAGRKKVSWQKSKSKGESVGILGLGEIGSAIKRVCQEVGLPVYGRDLDFDELGGKKIEVLHICIPYKEEKSFLKTVADTIAEVNPKITVINSTVAPGTTQKIYAKTRRPLVYSPVIGRHPDIYSYIKHHFTKIIGPVNQESAQLAVSHFNRLDIPTVVFDSPLEAELGKLLDIVYYAWNIVFCKWAKETADDLGANFTQVYTDYNGIYNEGYARIMPNVRRPILVPVPGPIGGHCVIPDTEILNQVYPNEFTQFILRQNRSYKKEIK